MVRIALVASLALAAVSASTVTESGPKDALVTRAEAGKLARRQLPGGLGGLGVPAPGGLGPMGGGGGGFAVQQIVSLVQVCIQRVSLITSGISSLSIGVFQQQLLQLVTVFQQLFVQFNSCSCFGQSSILMGAFSQMFAQFNQLIVLSQQTFAASWSNVFQTCFSSVSGFSSQFTSFFQSCSQFGIAPPNFLPPGLTPFFNQCGLPSVANFLGNRFGYK